MSRAPLGEQELELLRYIETQGPVTVGEVTEGFAAPRGLARSTVKTVMERLHHKGYLIRSQEKAVYQYAAALAQDEILGNLVSRFVEKTLAGSLAPFVTYFSRTNRLTPDELSELERLVSKLQQPREESKP
jgi:predicted transcriptional regulator